MAFRDWRITADLPGIDERVQQSLLTGDITAMFIGVVTIKIPGIGVTTIKIPGIGATTIKIPAIGVVTVNLK